MMGQHDRSEALFYYFRLEDQVPETHDSVELGRKLVVVNDIQKLIGITDGVTEVGEGGSVGLNLSIKLGNHGCPVLNRIAQLAATVVSVDSNTEFVAGRQIARVRRADAIARRRLLKGWSLHTRNWLAHYETELGVQGEGTRRRKMARSIGRLPTEL